MLTSALMMPPVMHVTAVPAMMPLGAALFSGTSGGTDVTTTVARPLMAPLVAETVFVKVPATPPAVNMPVRLMAPPPAATDHVGEMAMTLLPASLPTAVNCCVPLAASVSGFGVTVMLASAPALTTTVAVPEMVPLAAFTVFGKEPSVVPAVNNPLALMAPPLATTDHVGVIVTTLFPASLPTAVNCCVALMDSVSGFGVTVMLASGPIVTITLAVPEIPPLAAWTVAVYVPGTMPAVNRPVAL